MCKTESSWEAAVQPRSSAQGPVMASRGGSRGGREAQEGATCIHTADSRCYRAESSTTL